MGLEIRNEQSNSKYLDDVVHAYQGDPDLSIRSHSVPQICNRAATLERVWYDRPSYILRLERRDRIPVIGDL